jgi:hypothetical protein
MTDERERLEVLAQLMGMSIEEATDLIGDMTVKEVLTMRLHQEQQQPTEPDYDTVFSAFIAALNSNTTATQDVLERLERQLSENGTPGFEAPKDILDEGQYLKEQLAGVVSTETPGRKFKGATREPIQGGLDVLAGAVRPRKARKSP